MSVKGFEPSGAPWEEMTTLPLPKHYRQYDLGETSCQVFALIRHVGRDAQGRSVGVYYLGKKAPRGFEANPGGRYLLP